jgi:D-tagatose-1,6-bisphosphate aldolase subunit GatZ/KbaZ
MSEILLNIVKSHKSGKPTGIYSICSANPYVLEASMLHAKRYNSYLLIEATSNQVDQYGGYTGMTPKDFRNAVKKIADSVAYPFDYIVLGGDHLGPNVWRNENSASAMEKAIIQIKEYVKAGFTKIHLDTSMNCADDAVNENKMLDPHIATERAAILCKAAEEASAESDISTDKPVYIIGTDVPIPGGAFHDLDNIRITPVNEVEETINLTKKYFDKYNLEDAWKRTVAVVVQPGVEFSDTCIAKYDSSKSAGLTAKIKEYDNIVYEAHSTDYQTKFALKKLVEDHFAILKVGPWLTFALREAIFALAMIEEELSAIYNFNPSNIRESLITVMNNNPAYWKKYYSGNKREIEFAQKYSFSDRIRYYWTYKEVNNALQVLVENLSEITIPLNLLSQYMPLEAEAVMEERIENKPKDLIYYRIMSVLDKYYYAVKGEDQ